MEDYATAVITHRVNEGQHAKYEEWLDEIGPICRNFPGNLDVQFIRPIAGLTSTYTVIIRSNNQDNLKKWLTSPERKRLIEKVRPILATDDSFHIRGGLDYLFTPEAAKAKAPLPWKQFLVTWSAIYPLVLTMPLIMSPLLRRLGLVQNRYTDTLIVSGIMVWMMVYLIMPRYTKLIRHWLFK